jgi:3'-phosphoadenosine 5'-phosphosulfate sulfotransferase (PAPS reductase)/FAD synthetase
VFEDDVTGRRRGACATDSCADRGAGDRRAVCSAWIDGMRRVDAPIREDIRVVDHDAKRDMVKVSPIATWTDEDVREYADGPEPPRPNGGSTNEHAGTRP